VQSDPDVVFIVQEHVRRPELQYALRSWSQVPHGKVWMIGGCPGWVQNVEHVPFPDGRDKWRNIADKFRSLATLDGLSDWFYYTEDDYHILREFPDGIPLYRHETSLVPRVAEYRRRRKRIPKGGWEDYLAATLEVLQAAGFDNPESFDVHIPMPVEKARIPTHLKTPEPCSWRSLYGNFAGLDSAVIDDVKTGAKGQVERMAETGFLSSAEGTFRRSGVEAFLAARFPERCIYEREDHEMVNTPGEPKEQWRKDRLIRRVTRSGEALVRAEGGWVSEDSGGGADAPPVPSPEFVCDCGFVAKTEFGLQSHRRAKHPEEE